VDVLVKVARKGDAFKRLMLHDQEKIEEKEGEGGNCLGGTEERDREKGGKAGCEYVKRMGSGGRSKVTT